MTRGIASHIPIRLKAGTDGLRARLTALQADAIAKLAQADTIDGGLLRILVDANAALAALDAAASAAAPAPGDRMALVDDGNRILLVSYHAAQREPLTSVEMSPLAAVRLSAELSAAAARHLQKVALSLADALQWQAARLSEIPPALTGDAPAPPQGTSRAIAKATTRGAS